MSVGASIDLSTFDGNCPVIFGFVFFSFLTWFNLMTFSLISGWPLILFNSFTGDEPVRWPLKYFSDGDTIFGGVF